MLISGWQADEPISEKHILILQLQAGNWKKTNRQKDSQTVGQTATKGKEKKNVFDEV